MYMRPTLALGTVDHMETWFDYRLETLLHQGENRPFVRWHLSSNFDQPFVESTEQSGRVCIKSKALCQTDRLCAHVYVQTQNDMREPCALFIGAVAIPISELQAGYRYACPHLPSGGLCKTWITFSNISLPLVLKSPVLKAPAMKFAEDCSLVDFKPCEPFMKKMQIRFYSSKFAVLPAQCYVLYQPRRPDPEELYERAAKIVLCTEAVVSEFIRIVQEQMRASKMLPEFQKARIAFAMMCNGLNSQVPYVADTYNSVPIDEWSHLRLLYCGDCEELTAAAFVRDLQNMAPSDRVLMNALRYIARIHVLMQVVGAAAKPKTRGKSDTNNLPFNGHVFGLLVPRLWYESALVPKYRSTSSTCLADCDPWSARMPPLLLEGTGPTYPDPRDFSFEPIQKTRNLWLKTHFSPHLRVLLRTMKYQKQKRPFYMRVASAFVLDSMAEHRFGQVSFCYDSSKCFGVHFDDVLDLNRDIVLIPNTPLTVEELAYANTLISYESPIPIQKLPTDVHPSIIWFDQLQAKHRLTAKSEPERAIELFLNLQNLRDELKQQLEQVILNHCHGFEFKIQEWESHVRCVCMLLYPRDDAQIALAAPTRQTFETASQLLFNHHKIDIVRTDNAVDIFRVFGVEHDGNSNSNFQYYIAWKNMVPVGGFCLGCARLLQIETRCENREQDHFLQGFLIVVAIEIGCRYLFDGSPHAELGILSCNGVDKVHSGMINMQPLTRSIRIQARAGLARHWSCTADLDYLQILHRRGWLDTVDSFFGISKLQCVLLDGMKEYFATEPSNRVRVLEGEACEQQKDGKKVIVARKPRTLICIEQF
eukprot:TRINITY_DN1000_c0_g2_i1.p1 TRINITY_DN1000_c0_g2~~TRINITY_DN1000_c0_g2_i1.p1  ORF type:complete len:819 (-),score=73.03 TRINITY_DN1000_c0_g2_i1:1382-3838(-)